MRFALDSRGLPIGCLVAFASMPSYADGVWRWPLDGTPVVSRGFDPPPVPWAGRAPRRRPARQRGCGGPCCGHRRCRATRAAGRAAASSRCTIRTGWRRRTNRLPQQSLPANASSSASCSAGCSRATVTVASTSSACTGACGGVRRTSIRSSSCGPVRSGCSRSSAGATWPRLLTAAPDPVTEHRSRSNRPAAAVAAGALVVGEALLPVDDAENAASRPAVVARSSAAVRRRGQPAKLCDRCRSAARALPRCLGVRRDSRRSVRRARGRRARESRS